MTSDYSFYFYFVKTAIFCVYSHCMCRLYHSQEYSYTVCSYTRVYMRRDYGITGL